MVNPYTENLELSSVPELYILLLTRTKGIHYRLKGYKNTLENFDYTESLIDNVLLKILVTHHWHKFTISKTNTQLWLQYISLHSPI